MCLGVSTSMVSTCGALRAADSMRTSMIPSNGPGPPGTTGMGVLWAATASVMTANPAMLIAKKRRNVLGMRETLQALVPNIGDGHGPPIHEIHAHCKSDRAAER